MARGDTDDPWADRRTTDHVMLAVMRVLMDHTDVSYYTVDWRGWLFGPACGAEQDAMANDELVQDPDDCCGSHSIAYTDGGGGYLERFSSRLGEEAAAAGQSVSERIVDYLRGSYDSECEHAAHPAKRRWRKHDGKPRMTFEQIMAKAGWTPEVLAEIDLAVEDEQIRMAGGQLTLALAWAA